MPDTHLRGADAIHGGELEVGYDASFERTWLRVVQVGRVVMALVIAAGLTGLLGRGPYSHRRSATASGAMTVDFEPLARYGTATMVTLHLDTKRFEPAHDWVVHINNAFVEPMGLKDVMPRPSKQAADGPGLALTVSLTPDTPDSLVRFYLHPTAIGRQHLEARVGPETIDWEQVVLP
jgi:hypothetical protein